MPQITQIIAAKSGNDFAGIPSCPSWKKALRTKGERDADQI
jgi:hypothetical protein